MKIGGCTKVEVGIKSVHIHLDGIQVSVSFAFMGNFHEKEADPLAIVALKGIISYGVSQGLLSTDYKMYGHRDARPTISPGDKLYSQIQTFDHFDHNKPVKPTN